MYYKNIKLMSEHEGQNIDSFIPEKYDQYRKPINYGQVQDFNRTKDGFTDPAIFPAHIVIPNDIKTLVPEGTQWSLIHDHGTEPITAFNPKTKECTVSVTFLQFVRSGKHKYAADAEKESIARQFLLHAAQAAMPEDSIITTKMHELIAQYKALQQTRVQERKPITIASCTLNMKSGDFKGNGLKIAEKIIQAKHKGVHLINFQELSASSYQTRDAVNRPEYLLTQIETLIKPMKQLLNDIFTKDLTVWLKKQNLHEFSPALIEKLLSAIEDFEEDYAKTDWALGDCKTIDLPQKQEFIYKQLTALLADHPKQETLLKEFQSAYEDFGIAIIFPAALYRGRGNLPYNGAYAFRMDGSLAIQDEKNRLPEDPSAYFDEKRHYEPGDPNKKRCFKIRGHIIGISNCEDIWQEADHKIIGKNVHATGGMILDANLKEVLLTDADININVSASPTQLAKLIPHNLKALDWNNLPENFVILEGQGFTYEGPRMDTRLDLVKTLAKEYGTIFSYTNSVGALDEITMDGSALLINAHGELIGSSKQHTDTMLVFSVDKNKKVTPAQENMGNLLVKPVDEAIQNIAMSIADYINKTGINYVTYYNDGTTTGIFLQRMLYEAQRLQAEYIVRDLIRRNPELANENKQEMIRELYRKKKIFKLRTHIMPTLNHRFFTELFNATSAAIKYRSSIQSSVLFFPDMLFSPSSIVLNAILKNAVFVFGMSVCYTLAVTFLVVWPLIRLASKILAPITGLLSLLGLIKPGIKKEARKKIDAALEEMGEAEPELKQLYAQFLNTLNSFNTPIKKNQRVERRKRIVDFAEVLFVDLLSLLRGTLVWFDRKVNEAFGRHSLHIGSLTGDKKNLGQFTAGGVESSGFNPLHTVPRSETELMYFHTIKQDLAKRVGPLEHAALKADLDRRVQLMAGWVENEPLIVKIFKNIPLIGKKFWSIEKAGIQKYEAHIWKSIRALSTDPKRQAQLDKIIKRLDKKPLTQSPVKEKHIGHRLPKDSELLWNFRDTRFNKPVPKNVVARLGQFLTDKDIKGLVLRKGYIDHTNEYSWKEYAHLIAWAISRHDSTRHKNNAVFGSFLKIKTAGSHQEALSQEIQSYNEVLAQAETFTKQMRSINVQDIDSFNQIIGNYNQYMIITNGANGWVNRDYEKLNHEEAMNSLRQNKESAYPLVIIDTLNNVTDINALKLANKLNLRVMVVTSPEEIGNVRLPEKITDINYFYVFESKAKKDEFIKRMQPKPTLNDIIIEHTEQPTKTSADITRSTAETKHTSPKASTKEETVLPADDWGGMQHVTRGK